MLTWISSILLLINVSVLFYNSYQLKDKLPSENFTFLGIDGFVSLSVLALLLVVIAIAVCINTVILAHRMIGSSFAIRKTIKELQTGNFKARVRLREGDYFLDVARELNKFIDQFGDSDDKEKADDDTSKASVSPDADEKSEGDPAMVTGEEQEAKEPTRPASEESST